MKKVFRILLIFFLMVISGCEEKEQSNVDAKIQPNKKVVETANTMQPKLFKGMYAYPDDAGRFTDCDSKKQYMLSNDGEIAELERVYSMITRNKKQKQKVYIEAEGFTSAQSKQKGRGLDSVLIITRFVKLDTAVNCEK